MHRLPHIREKWPVSEGCKYCIVPDTSSLYAEHENIPLNVWLAENTNRIEIDWHNGVLELNEEMKAMRLSSKHMEIVYSSFFDFDFSVSDNVFTFLSLTTRVFIKVEDIQSWLVRLWKVVK